MRRKLISLGSCLHSAHNALICYHYAMNPVSTVILTGRPGSGKGTQGKQLAEKRGWVHFSTGEKFKAFRDGTDALSLRVREAFDVGQLLPDWFATYLFEDVILKLKAEEGIVLDGYPRSRTQAEIFHEISSWLGRPYAVVDLSVPPEEVMARMLLRAETEHRPDSGTEEQIRARLAVYDEHTAPVLEYFREKGTLKEIDGTGTPEDVAARISGAFT